MACVISFMLGGIFGFLTLALFVGVKRNDDE